MADLKDVVAETAMRMEAISANLRLALNRQSGPGLIQRSVTTLQHLTDVQKVAELAHGLQARLNGNAPETPLVAAVQ